MLRVEASSSSSSDFNFTNAAFTVPQKLEYQTFLFLLFSFNCLQIYFQNEN